MALIVGLVLAAGLSRRFGSDKRQAQLDSGTTLFAASLSLAQSQLPEVSVVLRPADDATKLGITHSVRVIRSESSDLGLGHSLASGIRNIAERSDADAVAIFLGDMPWISAETLTLLFSAADRDHIVQPICKGRPGHPVIFGRRFWAELLHLTGDTGAKAVVKAHPEALVQIMVNDPGVLLDVDTPAALDP